ASPRRSVCCSATCRRTRRPDSTPLKLCGTSNGTVTMSKRTSLSHWSLLSWALLSATSIQTASAQAPAPASTSAQAPVPASAGVEVDTPTTVSPQELAPRDPAESDRTRADEQVVQLSAEQAVARALGFSPSLRVAGYEQRAASEAVRAEEGRYPYSLIGDVG